MKGLSVAPVELTARDDGSFEIPLDALVYCWLRVGGLDYVLRRSTTD